LELRNALLTLPATVEATLVAHARREAPSECCGLLLGDGDAIVEAHPARNLAADPSRHYLVDPRDHLAAIRRARGRKLEVVGGYHSHPASAAKPSQTDADSGFSDFLFVIVGLGAAQPDVAGWTWTDGNFTRVPLVRGS
jgi:proteasome lid subunit RPN8/RPN11